MPMSDKGKEVMGKFMKRYGKKTGEKVAYATANEKGKKSKLYSLFHKG